MVERRLPQVQINEAMDNIVAARNMLARLRGQPTLAPAERWSEVVANALGIMERSLDVLGPGWDRGSGRELMRLVLADVDRRADGTEGGR